MRGIELYTLCLCFVLVTSELVGPDSLKETEEDDQENERTDDDDEAQRLMIKKAIDEDKSKFDPETLKDLESAISTELEDAVNKEILTYKEYIETLKSTKELMQGEDTNKLNNLKQMRHTLKRLKSHRVQHPPTWRQDRQLSEDSDNPEIEILEIENPQLMLDSLPPVPEEGDEELTPELQNAKSIYEAAMKKLKRRTPDLMETIGQIKQAADVGYTPARIKIAWSHIYGEGVSLDIDRANEIFEELAEKGNAEAHAGMGFLYASGIGVNASAPRALVHYTLGALGDSAFAQMALAYRHWAGVSVPASCSKALDLYMKVAAKVASEVTFSGGPAVLRTRLVDEAEGGGALDTDLIEYYQLLAEKGDVQAQVGLGQLHFQGGRGVTLDLNKALHYFTQAAKTGNAVANAFLGKIYLEGGDGIKADNETALWYFKKAAELNNPVGQSGLGLMYLQGRGVEEDATVAFKYFTMAANQGWVDGQLHLGFMYFSGVGIRRDFKQANKYFSLASQSGHVLALYHLAQMHAQGLGVMRSCSTAVELFKNVCERGSWSHRLMAAHSAWRARDPDSGWLQYRALAERGLEVAQSNAAHLLEQGEVSLFPPEERHVRALQLWSRAAQQGCGAARVKLGDYHYYGHGTARDLEAAAHHYRIASEQLHNAQATFNLGYMHERGLGLAKDLHLAKRCYDLAADTSPDARLPAALALAALTAGTALDTLYVSPLTFVFLQDQSFLANWDVYAITLFAGLIGILAYWRRQPEARPHAQPQAQGQPQRQGQPQTQGQPQAQSQSQAQGQPQGQGQPQTQGQGQPQTQAQGQPQAQAQGQPQAQAQPQMQAQPQAQVQTEASSQPKTQPESQTNQSPQTSQPESQSSQPESQSSQPESQSSQPQTQVQPQQ